MDTTNYLGKRIVCDNFYGTILYYGTVPPTEGLWFGVDWDEPSRGKHDGTHENVKYFSTRLPTSGSFIRPQKADFGISYAQGVHERYNFDVNVTTPEMFVMGDNQVVKPVELIGMDKIGKKQSEFNQLKEVCLHGMKIRGCDQDQNAAQLTPNVVELVLSKNLLTNWKDVAWIIMNLKYLHILNLSENYLTTPETFDEELKSSFKTLKEIALNKMDYDWNDILLCAELWPEISQLLVAYNKISTISKPKSNLFCELTTLDMESNPIVNWNEILELGQLPKLKSLNVSNCGIRSVQFPDALPGDKTSNFSMLEILGLNDNKCEKWTDVAELNKLNNLIELRMRNNPICECYPFQTTRQLFIAKIGNLKMLNRVEIIPGERKGAEVDYLKKFGRIWLDLKDKRADSNELPIDFITEHPRYLELVKRHGASEESELKTQKLTLNNKLISINIYSPLSTDQQSIRKKLPLTMSVQKVKGMLRKLLRVESQNSSLSYVSKKNCSLDVEIPLDNDYKDLGHYSIEDGDTIIVRW